LFGSLCPGEARSVKEAVEILNSAQTTPKHKGYKQFLHDVHSKPGPHVVPVCAVALGQAKVVDMCHVGRYHGMVQESLQLIQLIQLLEPPLLTHW